jgi:DNA-binding CsgD family transcriptional regulator
MDGDRLTPRHRIAEPDRQAVLDAAALLQVRRTETATALAEGRSVDAEVVDSGPNRHSQLFLEDQSSWTELLSVRPAATSNQLRGSLPNTRRLLTAGLRMTSVYDADGVSPDARLLLAGERVGTYLVSVAPVQMKIINREHVLLQGPFVDGRATVMAVRSRACLDAAWRYWEVVQKAAIPVGETVDPPGDLTPRQGQVVALMASGANDDAIAAALGVSVRTVRSDVAGILDALGVQSRFAAGVRLQFWSEGGTR